MANIIGGLTGDTKNNLTPLELTKYSRNILKIMDPALVMQKFADEPDKLDEGEGLSLVFTRQLRHGKTASDMNALTSDTPQKSTSVDLPLFTQFTVTPTPYGDWQDFSLFHAKQAFLNWTKAASTAFGNWYKEGVDYMLTKEVSTKCYLMRADEDSSYELNGAATAVGTTTTLVDTTNLTQANDYWNGGVVVCTSGVNEGIAKVITDFDNGTRTITYAAMPKAFVVGDTFHVCTTTGLTTGDKITTSMARRALRQLKDNKAPMFEGNTAVGILDPYQEFDYIEALIPTAQYTERGIKKVFDNEAGMANGIRWVYASQSYRADAALFAENTSGDVRVCLIMGRHAYGTLKIGAGNTPKLVLQSPLGGSTDAHKRIGRLAVNVDYCATMLNSLNVVGLATVPSK